MVTKIHGLPKQRGEESSNFLFSGFHLELRFENHSGGVPVGRVADPSSLPEDAPLLRRNGLLCAGELGARWSCKLGTAAVLRYPFPPGTPALRAWLWVLFSGGGVGGSGLRDSPVERRVRQGIQPGASGSIAWMQPWCRAGLWRECWTMGTGSAADGQGWTFSFQTPFVKAASTRVCLLYARRCRGLWAPWTSRSFSPRGCVSPS